jgi:hypothetical protein
MKWLFFVDDDQLLSAHNLLRPVARLHSEKCIFAGADAVKLPEPRTPRVLPQKLEILRGASGLGGGHRRIGRSHAAAPT